MSYRLLLLPLFLLLAACQTTRLERDFDASRDFAAYRSWSWQEPAVQYVPADPRLHSDLTTQRVREAVAEELDQRGLRPAQRNPDLKVQVWMLVEQRQDQVTDYGGGGYWGNPWGFWGAPGYAETCSTAATVSWCGAAVPSRCCRAVREPQPSAAWTSTKR
jgi:hypothetical protein